VEKIEAILEKYISGQMSESEKDAFEKRLENSPDLASQLAIYKQHFTPTNNQEVADETEEEASNEFSISRLWPIMGIVLLIGTGLGWVYISKTSRHIDASKAFAQLLKIGPPDSLLAAPTDNAWVQNFTNHNYQLVIEQLKDQPKRTAVQNYYLALSYAAYNRDSKAQKTLKNSQLEQSPFVYEQDWLQALIFAKNRQPEKAKVLLLEISNSTSPYAVQASQLLNQ
jgi:hypothetical protein